MEDNQSLSTLTKQVLSKYKNQVFVETGTHNGDGLLVAIDTGGFEELHSLEVLPDKYAFAQQRLAAYPQVHLHLGDSRTMLWDVIKDINRPITFWLDAHFIDSPIHEELAAITKHPLKNHSILIDDVRLWYSYNLSVSYVQDFLRKLNPAYKFALEPNFVGPEDIFAACISSST